MIISRICKSLVPRKADILHYILKKNPRPLTSNTVFQKFLLNTSIYQVPRLLLMLVLIEHFCTRVLPILLYYYITVLLTRVLPVASRFLLFKFKPTNTFGRPRVETEVLDDVLLSPLDS